MSNKNYPAKYIDFSEFSANKIGFIFQSFNLNPILNAVENVAIALRINGISKKEALQKAKEVLTRVGLKERFFHYPNELSGGEQQRVATARAIVKKPIIILADEPTGNLDSKTGIGIIKLLKTIVEEQNTTVIQVTHNLKSAKFSDYIIKLKDGKLAC